MKAAKVCLLTAMLCVAAWSATSAAHATGNDELARYRSQVRSVSAMLDVTAAQLRHSQVTIPIARVHLPPAPLGRTPTFSPSLDDWLQSNLASIRKLKNNRARAARLAELASSLRQIAGFSAAASAPRAETAGAARSILADAQYKTKGAGPAPGPHPSLWQRIWLAIERLLGEIFTRVFQGAASVPLIGQVLAALLLLALLGAIAFGLYALLLRVQRRARPGISLGQALPAALYPESLYDRGLAAASAGRHAEAVALVFQASLAYFDSAGKVAYDASRTAGEYRRLVRRTVAPASPYFDALAGVFTFVAYAERQASALDWLAAQNAFLALRPLVVT